MLNLSDLGPRIGVFGPSSAGKSTLAWAIGAQTGAAVHHLDLLHHQPKTDWVPRPEAEFEMLHAAAVSCDEWVIDGNYSRLLPLRLTRMTGAITRRITRGRSLGR